MNEKKTSLTINFQFFLPNELSTRLDPSQPFFISTSSLALRSLRAFRHETFNRAQTMRGAIDRHVRDGVKSTISA